MATNQADLILSYFKQRPGEAIPHKEVVDWATAEYERQTGKKFRDPDRAIRKWHDDGVLQKIRKGVYRYDPELAQQGESEDFSVELREQIYQRDNYRCVICGKGRENGIEIHADHIKPKQNGGTATLENGQTLCSQHNFLKKTYSQTEFGKRLFMRLLKTAQQAEDTPLIAFCQEVLAVYKRHNIDSTLE